jgi:hypothetical protein
MSQLKTVRSHLHERTGLALITTIMVLAVVGTVIGALITMAMASVRTAGLEYREGRVFYAAEAGGEAALAQIKLALQDGLLEDSELAAVMPPVLEGFSYDSFSVRKTGETVVETITDGAYAGLYAITQNIEVISLAQDASGNLGGVVLDAKAQAIPIFQFGVFFEQDLEATNGPPLEFVGRVHANGHIYLSSGGGDDDSEPNAWYRELITTPNQVVNDRKDFHDIQTGVYINDAEGNEVQLTFDSRSIPGVEAFKARSCADFDCRLQTDAFDVDSLNLPLPGGVQPYELLRPRDLDDGPAEKSVKFAWNADTYVIIDLGYPKNRASVCGYDPDDDEQVLWWPDITVERASGVVPNKKAICDILQWEWSAFYDGREDEMKDVLTLDVRELYDWIGGNPSRSIEIIYFEFRVPADISGYNQDQADAVIDATFDPAVRVKNGDMLPGPLTIAMEWPLYVEGNYNTVPKRPAAFAADGITILSQGWRDDENRPAIDDDDEECEGTVSPGNPCPEYLSWVPTWYYEKAKETTVNAGVIAGHWATPCDHHAIGCAADGSDTYYSDWYGGGIENFPRFLETWRDGGKVLFHYRGALISPFTSQKTTGTWNGTYYRPPQRDWAFDTDFRNPELLPPGTPNVGNVIRTAMREAF